MDGTPLQSVIVETEHLGALVTEELNAKWRELLASHRAYWSPGMLVRDGDRHTEESRYPRSVRVPDWDDPATLGCLLGQVREAHDDWSINPVCVSDLGPANGWRCWPAQGVFPTEASALVAALVAALEGTQ